MSHSRGDQVDTNYTRGAPYNIWDGKKRPKFSAFFRNFRVFIANISGMDRHIENPKSTSSTTFHPLLGEKKLVNFGPLTTKL